MLIGEYTHTLDEKKRLSLPASFRTQLGKGAVITRGLDQCLCIYSAASWKAILAKTATLSMGAGDSRGFVRFLLSGAAPLAADASGRVLIPEHLKQFAQLSGKVVFAGVGDRVEVWDHAAWTKYTKRIEGEGEQMAERLSAVGAL